MPSPRPAPLLPLLLALAALGAACPGRTEGPPHALPAPQLPGLTLPDATVAAAYSASVAASGGAAPLRYALDGLPPGLTYDSATGALSGRPTQPGSHEVRASVVDARGAADGRAYGLRVLPAAQGTPLQLRTGGLTPAQAGVAYSLRLESEGGTAPLQWSVVGGRLPAGLALAADGTLSGTPRAAQLAGFSLQVRDAKGAAVRRSFVLQVLCGAVAPASAVRVANWNVEWFGDAASGHGPSNEALQQANVLDLLRAVGADVWALQEVVDVADFEALEAQLPGYDGFVSSDPRVTDGPAQYGPDEQKLALLYRTDRVQVLERRLILADRASLFAGRPPLQVRLRVTGAAEDLYLVVLHLKAQATESDRLMRADEAAALKDYLDSQLPSQRVLVLGDWNDDLDASTAAGAQTPFQSFLDDPTRYAFLTWTLTQADKRTTAGFPTVIDHQLATNELVAAASCDPLTVPVADRPDYKNVTSDHLPVLTAFDLRAAQPAPGAQLVSPNGGELLAGASHEIRWAPGGSNALHVEYALEGRATWETIASGVTSSAGRQAWSLPPGVAGRARVRLVDAASGAVLDVSSCPFTLGAGAAVLVNEVLADPTGYTGGATDFGNQYVELFNASALTQDLSGLTLNEEEAYAGFAPARHTFPPGTSLAAGRAHLLWSRNTNGGDGLRLDRSAGDAVYLQDADGCVLERAAYGRAPTGPESVNRSPDTAGTGALVNHSTLGTGFNNSPGARANRAAF